MSGQRYPVGTRVYYWLHDEIRLDATVTGHGRVFTEIRLEDATVLFVQRSQLKKARLGTATDAVLRILSVPRDFPWLSMRDIIAIGADRGLELSLNAVASALANLEPDGYVEVRRERRPYRYRGCS